jgi:hypothetical protein
MQPTTQSSWPPNVRFATRANFQRGMCRLLAVFRCGLYAFLWPSARHELPTPSSSREQFGIQA